MKHIGIDLGASKLRLAEVSGLDPYGRVRISAAYEIDTPPLSVVAGSIVEPEVVAGALKDLFSAAGVGRRGVNVGVSCSASALKLVELPAALPPKAWESAFRTNGEDLYPWVKNIDSALSFRALPGAPDPKTKEGSRHLVAAAVHREEVASLLRCLKEAGVVPARLDLAGAAAFRAMAAFPGSDTEGVTTLVDVGHSKITVATRVGHYIRFLNTISNGGEAISSALRGEFGISRAEAEKLVLGVRIGDAEAPSSAAAQAVASAYGGLGANEGPEEEDHVLRAARAATSAADRLIADLARVVETDRTAHPGAPATSLILCGRASLIPGLAARIERATGISTALKQPFVVAEGTKVAKSLGDDGPETLLGFVTAAGLAAWELSR